MVYLRVSVLKLIDYIKDTNFVEVQYLLVCSTTRQKSQRIWMGLWTAKRVINCQWSLQNLTFKTLFILTMCFLKLPLTISVRCLLSTGTFHCKNKIDKTWTSSSVYDNYLPTNQSKSWNPSYHLDQTSSIFSSQTTLEDQLPSHLHPAFLTTQTTISQVWWKNVKNN